MLIVPVPYNVDRVMRKIPIVTYSLIGINVLIYILSILVSNLSLYSDRLEAQQLVVTLTQNIPLPSVNDLKSRNFLSEEEGVLGRGAQVFQVQPENSEDSEKPLTEAELGPDLTKKIRLMQAMSIVSKRLETPEDIKRQYLLQHIEDNYTDEPHYSILNSFAYRPNDPSVPEKIFTMFTAMFLHGSLDHLLGNMLFLWVFGRAIEEFLGLKFYLSTYLSAGVAATLMQHWVTQTFLPTQMGVPNLGASGAIAGVLGLFGVRFYRTKVRVFYLFIWGVFAFGVLLLIARSIFSAFFGGGLLAGLLGAAAAFALMYVYGRGNSWGMRRISSVWAISIWIVVFNIGPAIWEMSHHNMGGVAYWAHLGGLLCGAAYALAIGGVEEGKSEYDLEDAHTALQVSGNDEAIRRADALLQKDSSNAAAHEVSALAYDRSKNLEEAKHHYNLAIEGFWKTNERDSAARLYGMALANHPNLQLRPSLLLSISNHYALNNMWDQSAGTLTRIVDEFPESPEAEIALLRAAQLWMKQYDDPGESLRMMEMFRERYPRSEWMSQARSVEKTSQEMLAQRQ